jgi:hypothetical protein
MDLAHLMVSRGIWVADLWGAVISAWRQLDLDDRQWEEVLKFLTSNDQVVKLSVYEVSQLLDGGTKGTDHDIPLSTLTIAKIVATNTWLASEHTDSNRGECRRLVVPGYQSSGGTLVTFWLRAVSEARREFGDAWKGLPNDDKGFLEQVITGKSYAAELGRIVIASQAHFLFSTFN